MQKNETFGKNEVLLEGYLKFPDLRETKNGYTQFQGKIQIPFVYKDKATGEMKEGSKYVRISAWGETASELSAYPDGTPMRIHGSYNDRSYDGNCKDCGSVQKKNWSDVLVATFRPL